MFTQMTDELLLQYTVRETAKALAEQGLPDPGAQELAKRAVHLRRQARKHPSQPSAPPYTTHHG